ncbi:MAG: DUF418 domain-containing protein [Bacillaceae bacterium]|nr:DUF418 domain-containing protein [Bacillaceae bacterium]
MRQERDPSPIQPGERMPELDVIRGVAILGIFIVNMAFFSYPVIYLNQVGEIWWPDTWWNRITEQAIEILAQGKFYTMFSFLFGLGMFIFMERAAQKGANPVRLYVRRLIILLMLGIIHAFLIWSGDILLTYALLGFPLILFRHAEQKKLLIGALVMFMIPAVIYGFFLSAIDMMAATPEGREQLVENQQWYEIEMKEAAEQAYDAYGEGTYADMTAQRIRDLSFKYEYFYFTFPPVFMMFLLGMYAGKRRIFQEKERHLPFVKKVWRWSLAVGTGSLLVYVPGQEHADFVQPSMLDFVVQLARMISEPAICLFYISSLFLMMQKKVWRRRLFPISAVGRLAISNYLFQSVVATTLFYHYGFGLYGQVGPLIGLVVTFVIYGFQLVLSRLWMDRFRYGPVEWLWRSLTYGKIQPMKARVDSN